MKFGHLTEYNMVENLAPVPFIENQKETYIWIKSLNCYTIFFLLYVQVKVY